MKIRISGFDESWKAFSSSRWLWQHFPCKKLLRWRSGSRLVRGQVNVAHKAKLCSPVGSTFEALVGWHLVGCCEELGPFCWLMLAAGIAVFSASHQLAEHMWGINKMVPVRTLAPCSHALLAYVLWRMALHGCVTAEIAYALCMRLLGWATLCRTPVWAPSGKALLLHWGYIGGASWLCDGCVVAMLWLCYGYVVAAATAAPSAGREAVLWLLCQPGENKHACSSYGLLCLLSASYLPWVQRTVQTVWIARQLASQAGLAIQYTSQMWWFWKDSESCSGSDRQHATK